MYIPLIDRYTKEELENIIGDAYSIAEVLRKLGYSTSHGSNRKTLLDRIKRYNIDISHFRYTGRTKRNDDNVFCENSTASQATLRRHYKKQSGINYRCTICNCEPEWNGNSLTLILDHINGINNDNRLSNLRWVCPNCNQQLDTTGYKGAKGVLKRKHKPKKEKHCAICNKSIVGAKANICIECANYQKRKTDRPSREKLKQLIRIKSFREIGREYGNVSDNAVRKWCDRYMMPRRKKDIFQYSDEEWEVV